MTPATTQEPLAEQQAGMVAPMAVRNRWLRPVNRGDVVARERRRLRRQQIIRRRRRGTLMRHFFSLPRPVATLPVGMQPLPASGVLAAPGGGTPCLTARLPRAPGGAIDLPAIAAVANDHLGTAAPAQEQTARPRFGLPVIADTA
jgi:hypothetical protein